jgi:hypothetical protein
MGREPRHVAMSAGQSATLKPSESCRGDPTLPWPSHKTDTMRIIPLSKTIWGSMSSNYVPQLYGRGNCF